MPIKEFVPCLLDSQDSPLPLGVVSLKKFSRDQEAAYINHVLTLANQNKEEAAKLLDVSLATLYRKLAGEGG